MSILIPGMKMPPRGKVKMLVLFDDGVLLDNEDGQNQWRAIELPPHGDLIDRSKIAYMRDDSGLRSMDFAHRAQLENVTPVIQADPADDSPICTKASPASLGIYDKEDAP